MSHITEKQKEFEQTYLTYSEPIFRYCYFRISNRERAKEIMQETFMKTWTYVTEGKNIENMQAFLYKVARNLTINEVTRRKSHSSLDTLREEKGFDVAEDIDAINSAEARRVLQKIKEIGDEASELLIMRFIDDIPIENIAEILGTSKNVVSVRLHRALEKVRKIYK